MTAGHHDSNAGNIRQGGKPHSDSIVFIYVSPLTAKLYFCAKTFFFIMNPHKSPYSINWIYKNDITTNAMFKDTFSLIYPTSICLYYSYDLISSTFNTLRPRQMDAISQTTLSNAFSWMKMCELRLKFHWSLFARVQLTIFQHWFR